VLATHLEIAGGGRQGAMPQEDLDGAGIDARVEQMGRKAVPTLIDTLLMMRR
jgi:hypothetical protein